VEGAILTQDASGGDSEFGNFNYADSEGGSEVSLSDGELESGCGNLINLHLDQDASGLIDIVLKNDKKDLHIISFI
jgi:hypothetical protein